MDEKFDTVILGSGIAGLSAALAAQRLGLKSVVLEKAREIGGGTCYSTALIWIGSNHLAKAQGIDDPPESVLDYMRFLGGGQEEPRNMRAFIAQSPRALQYFERCGIPFRLVTGPADHYFGVAPGALRHGRTLEAELVAGEVLGQWKDRVLRPKSAPYCVTAQELFASRARKWDPELIAQRRRQDLRGLGVGLITHFLRAALGAGVEVRRGQTVTEIVPGKGVRLKSGKMLRARAGVVIATGGYESNPELVKNFEGLPGWHSYFPASLSGDGLILGSRAGGAVHMIQNQLQLFLGFPVPIDGSRETEFRLAGIIELTSPHTIVVNRGGQRFADESVFQRVAARLREFDVDRHEYANLPCFLVFDSQFTRQYSFGGRPVGEVPAWVQRADTPQALAKALSIDGDGLLRTIGRFNAFAERGEDQDFGRRGDLRFPDRPTLGSLQNPPFYGLQLRPAGASSAGLLTNHHAQVLGHDGRAVNGVYAIGNAAAKTELGVGYQAGLTMASGMTFGLLAARHMRR
jgi:3-oxosteroid 1-dehydrogenase